MTAIVPKKEPVPRLILRERERRARERRARNLQHMRSTYQILERAAALVHTLDDEDADWDSFLDDDSRRLRQYLRHTTELTREAMALTLEHARLQQLVQERRLTMRVLKGILVLNTDTWESNLERWRLLVHHHFKPWSLEQCIEEMQVAIKECNAFRWRTDKLSSGINFLGWRDHQRIDRTRNFYQFQFSKTFHGYNMMEYVQSLWQSQTDEAKFNQVVYDHRALTSLEVVQHVTPTIWIARTIRRYKDLALDAHMMYLVFQVQDEKGITLCLRSICCPELIKVFNGPRDMWVSMLSWFQWERLDEEDDTAFKLRIGGSVGGTDTSVLNEWLVKLFGEVLRSEQLATKRQLITSD